jgi:HAD superfamily hydrolase (TIGR01509 family)
MTDDHTTGLLFDMDGTLLDSTPIVEAIWTEFADRHGLAVAEVIGYAHGRPTQATVSRFVGHGTDVSDEVARVAAAEAAETRGITALPGAKDLLESLPDGSWAVVTSATRTIATVRMAAAGLPRPPVLISSEDVDEGKPAPEGYLKAAQALGLDIAACVVFEDAGPGILAGRAAGAEVVVVGGYGGEAADGLARIADFRDLARAGGPRLPALPGRRS